MAKRQSHTGARILLASAFLLMASACAGLTAATPSHAGPVSSRDMEASGRQIDEIFAFATRETPGCSLAVAKNGRTIVSRSYGQADLGRNIPIGPDTVFDIGSVQKQFIAASALLLVGEGRLSLTDDIRKYMPELPDYGHTITIEHLITHTSGVRDWTALLPLASDRPDALAAILRQRGLNFAPGEEWSYSNSGIVLLREIVARRSGLTFAEFARTRLFEPLGMQTAVYSTNMRTISSDRALGYEMRNGEWGVSMRVDEGRGGGGILASPADLLIWNEALSSNRLGKLVTEKLEEPARLNNGRPLQYAHGLIVDTYRGARRVWHSGGSGGYNTLLARWPEQGLSLALTCNSDVNGGSLANKVIDLFWPAGSEELKPSDQAPPSQAPDPVLGARTGVYLDAKGELLRLGVERGALRIAGGPPLTVGADGLLRAVRADPYFRSQDEFTLRFLPPDAFEIRSMEGKTTLYKRADAYTPTAIELREFEGAYKSTELQTIFQVSASGDALSVRLAHAPGQALVFRPVARDTFLLNQVVLRFDRGADGRIAALDYSNPLLRHIPAARQSPDR